MTKIQHEAAGWVLYTQQANEALQAMQEEKRSIDEYLKLPKANPVHAKIRTARLAKMYRALMTADELLKVAEQNSHAHYARGYKKGLEEGQRPHPSKEDREGFRAYTIQRAMDSQPDLF
jgi:flagellar biosynthesis/type III secretory pathway protein FliH